MGTWDAGPFNNDSAMDWVGHLMSTLMEPIHEFLDSPEIDETFDAAFASLAIINDVIDRTGARPWDDDANAVVDPAPIASALLACFDEQIDGMDPDPDFLVSQRAALVAELERFRSLVAP